MSITLLFGLLLELAALAIVLYVLGTRLLTYTGGLLVVMLCIYHGLTEVANMLFPGKTANLMLVDQEAVDRWVVLAGTAILIFSLVYVWTLKRYRTNRVGTCAEARPQVKLLLLLAIAVPSLIIALTIGQGNYRTYGYWLGGLSQALFLLATVMSFIGLILHCPKRWMPFLLLAEALLFMPLGSRLSVIAVFVMTVGGIARYGRPLRATHFCIGLALLAALLALVSSTRVYYGREMYSASSVGERLSNIGQTAVTAIDDSDLDLQSDFIYRFDGNIFPTMVNERFREGYSGVGLKSFAHNFLAFTPSFFYATKLDSAVEDRNERAYADSHFGLPLTVDLPTTLFTVLFGYYGPIGLLCCAAGLGIAFGRLDKWVNSSITPMAYCVGLALTYCCVFTEQGIEVYFLTFRNLIILLLLIRLTSRLSLGDAIAKQASLTRPQLGYEGAAVDRGLK
jgi:hypothetical protein